MSNYYCVCGHWKSEHRDFLSELIAEYEAMPIEKRKYPLEWYVNNVKSHNVEWLCKSFCECDTYKIDNLRYLEEKYVQAQQIRK